MDGVKYLLTAKLFLQSRIYWVWNTKSFLIEGSGTLEGGSKKIYQIF